MVKTTLADIDIRGLRRVFGATRSVHGMRLGNNLVDGAFPEQGYVYRIK